MKNKRSLSIPTYKCPKISLDLLFEDNISIEAKWHTKNIVMCGRKIYILVLTN